MEDENKDKSVTGTSNSNDQKPPAETSKPKSLKERIAEDGTFEDMTQKGGAVGFIGGFKPREKKEEKDPEKARN